MRGYEDALVDQWQMARYQAYMIYCVNTEQKRRVSVYDFHPLPGDPTKEEIAKMAKAGKEAMIERMIKKGHLKRIPGVTSPQPLSKGEGL